MLLPVRLWAGGESEAAGSDRGSYLAEQGQIIPAGEIHIDSYIAQIDYGYPDPEQELGVSVYHGRVPYSVGGDEYILHIGIQGARTDFDDLPVMNLALVLDVSGSMSGPGKRELVRTACQSFMKKVRPRDVVSIVLFSDSAETLLPATRVSAVTDPQDIINRVTSYLPRGSSAPLEGLRSGYAELNKNLDRRSVNRLIFVSDGKGLNEAAVSLAAEKNKQGISTTTVGTGGDFNLTAMVDLAKKGGGSSRFMEDQEKAENLFGADMDRMLVPVARHIQIGIELAEGTQLVETWGYRHAVKPGSVTYTLDSLHNRDYETILARIEADGSTGGSRELARLVISWEDREGRKKRLHPIDISIPLEHSPSGSAAPPRPLLKSSAMLSAAEILQSIGAIHQSIDDDTSRLNTMSLRGWETAHSDTSTIIDTLVMKETEELKSIIQWKKQRCFDQTINLIHMIREVHHTLGEEPFSDILNIGLKYAEIVGRELYYSRELTEKFIYGEMTEESE